MKKKLFVVSDIHGFFSEFKEALDISGYNKDDPDHLLIFCGDMFDRGEENMKVLQFFERCENRVMIRGNHEDMFLEIIYTQKLQPHNYINGTVKTVDEFFGKYATDSFGRIDFSGRTRTVDRICEMIDSMRDYYETKNYIFVHGFIPSVKNNGGYIPMSNWRNCTPDAWENARWIKWTDVYGKFSGEEKTVVCGHMPTFFAKRFDDSREDSDFAPFFGDGIIAVDAGTYSSGRVNIVVLEDELLR